MTHRHIVTCDLPDFHAENVEAMMKQAPAMLDALRDIYAVAQAAQECIFCDSPDTEHEDNCPVDSARAIIDRIEATE